MGDGQAHIVVTLDTKNPIEIGDFVSAFTSVANQYDKFMRENYPEIGGEARIFVNEVKSGSIIADLIPVLATFGLPASAISMMQQVDAITDFVAKYGEKLKTYFALGGKLGDASASDLKDFMGAISAIANDPDGKSSVEALYFEDKRRDVRAAVQFTTKEAREAFNNIESHRRDLQMSDHSQRSRVLMTFIQSNIKDPPKDKRSGERVIIEEISRAELPLVYASDLAEEKIKHEIREADENVFKRGFVVDVMIETRNGRPIAYKVTNLHQIIDLPDS